MVERSPLGDTTVTQAQRVITSADGALVALIFADRVEVRDVPDLTPVSEIGLDATAELNDVVFAGPPNRLVILTRRDGDAHLYVVDPLGPDKLADLEVATATRIAATSGDLVLVAGAATAGLVDTSRRDLPVAPLAVRAAITAAGPFGAGRFLICAGGVVEEWDALARSPTRRVRLSRPLIAHHVGGSEHAVWMIPAATPDRIEVIPLAGSTPPHGIDLPEPAARVAVDPSGDLLAIVGARTGSIVFVEAPGSAPPILLSPGPVADAAWIARSPKLVVVGAELEVLGVPAAIRAVAIRDQASREPVEVEPPEIFEPSPPRPAPTAAERLAAWRERIRANPPSEAATPPPPRPAVRTSANWRETVAAWARGVVSGAVGEPPVVDAGLLLEIADRLALDGDLTHALELSYGAHLCGLDGVAPVDLARVTGWRWREALGGGRLAGSGAMRWRRSRVRLSRLVATALDELPPRTGTIVTGDGRRPGVVAVIAPATAPLPDVAAWLAPRVGALLVPGPRAERRPDGFVLEARIRGLVPLIPARLGVAARDLASAVFVVDDAAAAAAVPAAVLGTFGDDARRRA
ncbi:MAG: hypothetical protein H6708_19515 [Kofleriaceae bacterium]|nr:hypothetical protein [Kofleriaceae bacterium]